MTQVFKMRLSKYQFWGLWFKNRRMETIGAPVKGAFFVTLLLPQGGQGVLPCERPMLIGVVSYAYQDAEAVL